MESSSRWKTQTSSGSSIKTIFGLPVAEPVFAHCFWRDYSVSNKLVSNQTHPTVWSPFPMSGEIGKPEQQLMLNSIAADLAWFLSQLKQSGIEPLGSTEDYPYGRFAWILDLEGNKVELWQPVTGDD